MRCKYFYLILITIALCSCSDIFEWGFVSELPEGAKIINQSSTTDDFLPDYDYYLAAYMTESDFINYIKKFKLTEHFDGREYGDENWSLDFLLNSNHQWWNPNFEEEGSKIFVVQKGDEWIVSTYQNGIMYLHGMSH